MENSKTKNVLTVIISVITAAYAIFMLVMRKTILYTFATEAERTVKIGEAAARSETLKWFRASDALNDVYVIFDDVTGITSNLVFFIWFVLSVLSIVLYLVAVRKILFADELGKNAKLISQIMLFAGFAYITYFAVIGDYTMLDKVKNITSSMIGLSYPIGFKIWGVLTSFSLFINFVYAARKHEFTKGALPFIAVMAGVIGCAAIYVTINVPSAGLDLIPDSARCLAHWSGALIFAFSSAIMIGFFLGYYVLKTRDKRYIITSAIAGVVLILMLVLLITVGKSAMIENLPIWMVYVILYLLNFTSVLDLKKD